MCTPSACLARAALVKSWPLFVVQVVLLLGAATYFFLAGFYYLEFYEGIPHTVTVDVQARTDTLDYVANVLGASAGVLCSSDTQKLPAFRTRFATAQAGAAPLNFTAACSSLEASMQAAAAVPAGRDARVPTSRVSYETVRVPNASAADMAALSGLGFRVVTTGDGASGVRATGTALRTDARFVTLEESLTVRTGAHQAWLPPDAESDRVSGRESKFGFRLVDGSGSVVRRCLRAGRLSSDLSLSGLSSSELEARVFTPCEAAAGTASWDRPVLTLDALLWSAGARTGLAHVIASSSSGVSSSSGGGVPVQVSGVSLDLEVTYSNLPPVVDGPDPTLLDVTARAVVAERREASWVGSGVSSSRVWTTLPGAAHKVLLPSATQAQCASLSWSSTSADVAACIAAGGGSASSVFDTAAAGAYLRRREEVYGAVVRPVPGGRAVRFSYTELASLGTQSLAAYLVAMTVVGGSAAACCYGQGVRRGVWGDASDQGESQTMPSQAERDGPSGKQSLGDAAPASALSPSRSGRQGWRSRAPRGVSVTFADKRSGGGLASPAGSPGGDDKVARRRKMDSLGASYLVLRQEVLRLRDDANLKRDRASAVLSKTTDELSDMDRTLRRLPKRAERKLQRSYGAEIAEAAASAARAQVVKSLTGRSLAQFSQTKG